jgi:hypothetical protein
MAYASEERTIYWSHALQPGLRISKEVCLYIFSQFLEMSSYAFWKTLQRQKINEAVCASHLTKSSSTPAWCQESHINTKTFTHHHL